MSTPVIKVIRPGDTSKPDPFTICIVANPALEAPRGAGQFITDPVVSDQPAFDAAVTYIHNCLFGLLPGQGEALLAVPDIAPKVRIVSLFVPGLPPQDANSLVANDSISNQLIARRAMAIPFLSRFGLTADVVYCVSKSSTHSRATAWFTSDDDAAGGLPFTLDGITFHHRFHHLIPGTIAIHTGASSLTALHEFQHALSSYSNGKIVDLYVQSPPAVNCKHGRPIPPSFANYNGTNLGSDPTRDSLGYPAGWVSFYCALHNQNVPAVMDNYPLATAPESCENDVITRRFILERLRAKISR